MKLTDFKKYSEKDAIENGSFLHFKDPHGKLMYADDAKKEAVGVTVCHVRSKEFLAVMDELRKDRKEKFGLKPEDEDTAEYTEYRNERMGLATIKEFHHITFDGDDKSASREDRVKLFFDFLEEEKIFFISDQINSHLVNRVNFMKGG